MKRIVYGVKYAWYLIKVGLFLITLVIGLAFLMVAFYLSNAHFDIPKKPEL